MGHRRFIRQKEGRGVNQYRLDNLLHPDRLSLDRYLLGEVKLGELVSGVNVRSLCATPIRASGG
jgi:hypothetical protein